MDDAENKLILRAMSEMHDIAQRDCGHYGDDRCTPEAPKCDNCQARLAYSLLEQMLTPCPAPLQESRLRNAAERIYWEEWCKSNERQIGLNSGFTTLEHILNPHLDNPKKNSFMHSEPPPPPVSTRDAQVAGAVIQWLGTGCGLGFIETCERRIEKERVERAWDGGLFPYIEEAGHGTTEEKVAEALANELIPASREQLQRYMKARFFKALRYLTETAKPLECERL